ncbi:hypothetical protein RJ639_026295 [Escallonia herrerae]|uniref:Terpene synthase metal-binding domain-containing protein n=1 Tax=Escallonia herrerae TaxID=1293975 RepID=A0AA88RWT7_9ASTE|nr:hypothetical protein RJ639_026295 [Escallonia herrerae]
MVECYFWAPGIFFEPRSSLARIILAKTLIMISILDDTYDAYSIVEELQIFAAAVRMYMKPLYRTPLRVYEEFEEEMTKQRKSFAAYCARKDVRLLNLYMFMKGY